MTVPQLVDLAASKPLNISGVEVSCKELNLSENELFDAFARHAAEVFLKNNDSWNDCDKAMNHLLAFASHFRRAQLPDFAFGVYLAFDAGEYCKPEDPKSFDPRSRTKAQLDKLGIK